VAVISRLDAAWFKFPAMSAKVGKDSSLAICFSRLAFYYVGFFRDSDCHRQSLGVMAKTSVDAVSSAKIKRSGHEWCH